jgi:hypothetical protein
MTKKRIRALKQQILGLNFDAHRKRSKAVGLSQKLMNAHEHAEFTKADYRAFFKSRRIRYDFSRA